MVVNMDIVFAPAVWGQDFRFEQLQCRLFVCLSKVIEWLSLRFELACSKRHCWHPEESCTRCSAKNKRSCSLHSIYKRAAIRRSHVSQGQLRLPLSAAQTPNMAACDFTGICRRSAASGRATTVKAMKCWPAPILVSQREYCLMCALQLGRICGFNVREPSSGSQRRAGSA